MRMSALSQNKTILERYLVFRSLHSQEGHPLHQGQAHLLPGLINRTYHVIFSNEDPVLSGCLVFPGSEAAAGQQTL
jgi:hypothetical protein